MQMSPMFTGPKAYFYQCIYSVRVCVYDNVVGAYVESIDIILYYAYKKVQGFTRVLFNHRRV